MERVLGRFSPQFYALMRTLRLCLRAMVRRSCLASSAGIVVLASQFGLPASSTSSAASSSRLASSRHGGLHRER
jgi:hypothetical protein